MVKRTKNRTSLQLDIPEETKLELLDIQELFQKNDPYGKVSLSKVIMILVREKHKYYTDNGYFEPIQEQKIKPIKSHKQTRLKLKDEAKNNSFDEETANITIEAIKQDRENEEDWRIEAQRELEEWRESIKERKKGI